MFEYAFVEVKGRSVRPGTFMASIAGELGVIGLGILLPLLFVDALPQAAWLLQHVPLVGPPPAKPFDAIMVETVVQPKGRAVVRDTRLFEPVKFPPKPVILVDLDAGAAVTRNAPQGVVYGLGDPALAVDATLADAMRFAPPAPPPPVKTVVPRPENAPPPRLRVGGNVQAPAPLYTPAPVYPTLAQQTRVEGIVSLEAIITTEGTVRSVKLVKGHPLLVAAAMAAVRTWRYTPPALNGEPIELEMYVEVNFKLNR